MRISPSAYQHSKIYQDFKELEMTEYRAVIRFFEDNEPKIKSLEFDEYFELLISYLTALHTIGAYSKYVEFVDIAIETSILQNIKYYKGEDIYQQLLFNKATAYYHMLEFKKSDHILKELIKLNPNKESFIKACKRCKRKIRPEYVHTTRASSIFLFMMSAVIIAIEVIVVEPFYNNYVGIVEAVRVGIFLVGIVMLLSGDLFHWWRVNKLVDKFITQVKKHKARKN